MADWSWDAFAGGVFGVNCLPHLLTAARGERMLTPFGGQDSGPLLNLAWGSLNLIACAALTVRATQRADTWTGLLAPFAAGSAACGIWGYIYDHVLTDAQPSPN